MPSAKNLLRGRVKINRMNAFKSSQARGHFIERRWEAAILAGKYNLVFTFVGFDNEDFVVKCSADSGDVATITRIVRAQVGDQDSALTQSAVAVVVELSAAQLLGLAFAVKAIDQQNVERIDFPANEVGAIGTENAEMIVIVRNAKGVAQGDYVRGKFDCGEVAFVHVESAILCQ